MPKIKVEIEGPSRSAYFYWDGEQKAMTNAGTTWTATFDAKTREEPYHYAMSLFGAPDEKWKAKISGGTRTNNHAGSMDADGYDDAGSSRYWV